jgi:hypothetical protein
MRTALFLFLLPVVASAQFTTNVWPAWQHPRHGNEQASQVYSSIVERVSVASYYGAAIDEPSVAWYRFQRQNLIDCKAALKACIPRFSNYRGTASELADLYNTPTNEPSITVTTNDYVYTNQWTVAAFIATNNLPTNYFEYTPWRCLDGLGPYTNDATVGRTHGWTNDSTVAGGPYLPPGRSIWYTTDYGWDAMLTVTNLTKRLVWESGAGGHTPATNRYTRSNWQTNATWAATIADCTISDSSYERFYVWNWGKKENIFPAAGDRQQAWYMLNGVDVYSTVGSPLRANTSVMFLTQWFDDTPTYDYTYDSFGKGYDRKGAWFDVVAYPLAWGWQVVSNMASSATATTTTYQATLSITNAASMTWADEPAIDSLSLRGYFLRGGSTTYIAKRLWIYDWGREAGPYGFKY